MNCDLSPYVCVWVCACVRVCVWVSSYLQSTSNESQLIIKKLRCIIDFEHSKNQRQCSDFSSSIGFNMGTFQATK